MRKDYALFMPFIKYLSEKHGNYDGFEPIILTSAGFKDMVALKGSLNIGNKINTQIIQSLVEANISLTRSDVPDFDDPNKPVDGQARVESTIAKEQPTWTLNSPPWKPA